MQKRFVALLMLVSMLLLMVPATNAQVGTACFTLDQEDCDAINAAAAEARGLGSFNQEFTLDVSVSGLDIFALIAPDAGVPATIDLSVTGSGPVAFTPDSEDILVFDVTMNADATLGMDTLSGPVQAQLVNNTLFLTFNDQTLGIPLEEAVNEAAGAAGDALGGGAAIDTQTNPANLTELLGLDDAATTTAEDALAIVGLGQFFDYVRLAEEDVNGAAASPFLFTADLNGLLASPELENIAALSGQDFNPEDLQILRDAILADFSVTQYVVNDTGLVQQLDVNTSFELDLGAAAGSPGLFDPIVLTIDFSVFVDEPNRDVTVTAPEEFELVDPNELGDALQGTLGDAGL